MTKINRFGLLIWLSTIAALNIKSPFTKWADFICFVILVIMGSLFLMAKNKND